MSPQDLIAEVLGTDVLTVSEIAGRARMNEMGAQSAVRAMQKRGVVIRIAQKKGLPDKFRMVVRSPA
ncbi:MAG: hypothetical protein GAK28_00603 [Luteibacter sp.]|uniref:hypothetical protein n=1 Tax=Luteibacter sp. TaxID=1886636 RepID=UPI0013829609|nr:hypothetical protein [Luteibacter sp.]KAF1008971.1 MAG: hypothetical protein GAK28_00603 [Luteibacter sp.]